MTVEEGDPSEIGRPLKADELRAGMIVVVRPPGASNNLAVTVWVEEVSEDWVAFFSGIMQWHVVCRRHPDGTITDDKERLVQIFEYLGEP